MIETPVDQATVSELDALTERWVTASPCSKKKLLGFFTRLCENLVGLGKVSLPFVCPKKV
jgi:hypothetical protein